MEFSHHLDNKERITDEDVIRFRRDVFQDMLVSRVEAEGVFALNNKIKDTSNAWNDFLVEVMVDYCVNQAKPQGYLSENNADWLVSQITKDGRVDTNSELELIIRVIERAKEVPTLFSAFALEQVAVAVIEGNETLLNNEQLKPGVIGAAEANLLRRILYGVGSEGRLSVSKEEVEVLFELNDMTIEAENHPEWTDVFIKAVACHLMAVDGFHAVGRKEALRREAWLDDTEVDVSGMLAKTLSSVGDLMKSGSIFGGALRTGSDIMDEAWRARNEEMEINEAHTSVIDENESHWLVDRIGRDGVIHENEKALLNYLKQESPDIHQSLKPLLDKVA
jgi:hypothetical protein